MIMTSLRVVNFVIWRQSINTSFIPLRYPYYYCLACCSFRFVEIQRFDASSFNKLYAIFFCWDPFCFLTNCFTGNSPSSRSN